jgi:UDP-glucuronate decarboxylase
LNKTHQKIIIEDSNQIIHEKLPWNNLLNKKILITGATGFIASNLINFLFILNKEKKLNLRVVGFVRDLDKANEKFKHIEDSNFLTFTDKSILEPINISEDFNYIFHMASIASPKYFQEDPIGVTLPNTLGTINLLNLADKNNLDKFIFFSTSGVNGFVDDNIRPISEDKFGGLDPIKQENCYLESKRMGENLCIAWYKQKKIPIQIVRPAITYGPGVSLDDGRSYADFINCIVTNKDITLFTKGEAIRNFCYISDFISGLFYVLFKGNNGEAYNVSTEEEYSIMELAKLLVNDIYKDKKLKIKVNQQNNSYMRVQYKKTTVSTKKLQALGWKLNHSIKTGMIRTISSYGKQ